jgi:restriction system protein
MTSIPMPTGDELQDSVLKALEAHGGKATNAEILRWTIENLKLSKLQLEVMRAGNRSEVEYRLAWARTRASKQGRIYRSGPSTWALGTNQ